LQLVVKNDKYSCKC